MSASAPTVFKILQISVDKRFMLCYITTVLIQIIQLMRGDKMIKLDYKDSRPLHEQITQGIKDLIICGVLAADEQLPSVRDLSVSLTVNPNTVQRAYKTLEAEGIIYSIRGKGSFVAGVPEADTKTIDNLYLTLREAMRELVFYGESRERIEKVLDKVMEEKEDAQ